MTLAIFSLGQLVSSNTQTLKTTFETSLNKAGIKGEAVWTWLITYLPKLRLNQININDLCKEFNNEFGVSMSVSDFKTNFNSMCHIEETSLANVTKFYEFLNENPGIQFLIVSHTNVSHFDFIMEQLERVIPDCRKGIIDNITVTEYDARILFATSMFSQCEQHPDTIKKLKINSDQPIISFLNTIDTGDKIELKDNFTYVPSNGALNIDKIIESLMEVHNSNTMRCGF